MDTKQYLVSWRIYWAENRYRKHFETFDTYSEARNRAEKLYQKRHQSGARAIAIYKLQKWNAPSESSFTVPKSMVDYLMSE